MRARLLIELERADEAVVDAQQVLETDPEQWSAHLILAAAADLVPELSREKHLAQVEAAVGLAQTRLVCRVVLAVEPVGVGHFLQEGDERRPGARGIRRLEGILLLGAHARPSEQQARGEQQPRENPAAGAGRLARCIALHEVA